MFLISMALLDQRKRSRTARQMHFWNGSHTAMKLSATDSTIIRDLLRNALTDKIADREMFMKGIDYSYYYEENN